MPLAGQIETPSKPAQRAAIVAAGARLGVDLDGLRAMTPLGSLRALTYDQAVGLLNSLNRGRKPTTRPAASVERPERRRRNKPGVIRLITERQRLAIVHLARRMGWGREALNAYLRHTVKVRSFANLARRDDASRAITGLLKLAEASDAKALRTDYRTRRSL